MGWKRTFRYVQHRLVRIKDTTSSIARGMAFGAVISLSLFLGHIFSLLRPYHGFDCGNVLASVRNLWLEIRGHFVYVVGSL